MRLDEDLYTEFLKEMNSLENFRIAHASAFPDVPLDRDDPDVKRLVEAMAFFSARTRVAAVSNVLAVQRRVFQQFFPFLLSTVPAMGILQARPTGQFTEPVFFPKGSEMAAPLADNRTAVLRTLHDLPILPIRISAGKMVLLPDQGFRFLLRVSAAFPRNDSIDTLSVHINYLNDFQGSLRVFHHLRKHLRGVSVVFDEEANESSRGIPCKTSFGPPPSARADQEESFHPLLEERWYFHFPQQELYVNFEVPAPPRNWSRFTLCLDLDSQWPRNIVLNEDVFHLFTVPVANVKRAFAEPVICDGTQERYSIRHPHADQHFELHSVLGVYEVRERKHLVPLRPGVISGGNGSFEIDRNMVQDKLARSIWLIPHFSEAFESPRTLAVDALWLQPTYSDALGQSRRIHSYDRTLPGIRWEWLGSVKSHEVNPLLKQTDAFTHLFTLANKTMLNAEDVASLLRALGTVRTGEFHSVIQTLAEGKVTCVPQRQSGLAGLIRMVYHLRLTTFDPTRRPLVEAFLRHMERVLDTWISDATIEVRLETDEERAEEKGAI
ncbi:MAG: type VI secretion system baseplate subunit TssF [Syntrophobacteraceae bacterium]